MDIDSTDFTAEKVAQVAKQNQEEVKFLKRAILRSASNGEFSTTVDKSRFLCVANIQSKLPDSRNFMVTERPSYYIISWEHLK